MTAKDAGVVLNDSAYIAEDCLMPASGYNFPPVHYDYWYKTVYRYGPDSFGNSHYLTVVVEDKGKVKSWEIRPRPRTRPPWLDTALKWVGW
jgi:hypothetical protein